VHGAGQVVIRRQLKRRSVVVFFQKLPPCLVGMEACGPSHHWARELQALGHAVRLMPWLDVSLRVNGRSDPGLPEVRCGAPVQEVKRADTETVLAARSRLSLRASALSQRD
jgi:hypothetical protein